MAVSTVQNGLHIVNIIFDLLGVNLGGVQQVAPQIPDEDTAGNGEFHPAGQVVVGYGLEPVALNEVPGQIPEPVIPGGRGGVLQQLRLALGENLQIGEKFRQFGELRRFQKFPDTFQSGIRGEGLFFIPIQLCLGLIAV